MIVTQMHKIQYITENSQILMEAMVPWDGGRSTKRMITTIQGIVVIIMNVAEAGFLFSLLSCMVISVAS